MLPTVYAAGVFLDGCCLISYHFMAALKGISNSGLRFILDHFRM